MRTIITFLGWWIAATVLFNTNHFILASIAFILYAITIARSRPRGKHRAPPPSAYHPHSGEDTKSHSIAYRATARAFYTLTGGTTSSGTIVHDDMPILAVRRAMINKKNNKWKFRSVNANLSFAIDADASCQYHNHDAPQWGCTCGFYAVPADRIKDYPYEGFILEVELSGVVIECDSGYRAQHQRIVGIYYDSMNLPLHIDGGYSYYPSHYYREIEEFFGIPVTQWSN